MWMKIRRTGSQIATHAPQLSAEGSLNIEPRPAQERLVARKIHSSSIAPMSDSIQLRLGVK